MKIRFLGTAAAEGMPAVFCNCQACIKAKEAGGKNIRTRSQILIGEDFLIDFPPDTYFHAITNRLDLSAVKHLFITHAHPDHCSPTEFALRGDPYAHNMTESMLHVYANATVLKHITTVLGNDCKPTAKDTVSLTALRPYQTIVCQNRRITALPAVHTEGEDCLIYWIQEGNRAFLQFNDSGILPDSVYEFLRQQGACLHAVAFDCTYGYRQKGAGRHMGFFDAKSEKDRMNAFGILDADCHFVLTHFSHNTGLLHEELQQKVQDEGFIVAFDGMELTI